MNRWIGAAILVALIGGAAAAPPAPSTLPVIPGGTEPDNSTDQGTDQGTVPSLPVEWQAMSCELHFSGITFGGLKQACLPRHHHHHHHRHHPKDFHTRCCPVLASWLYAAEAEATMEMLSAMAASPPPASAAATTSPQVELPVPPDDSSSCAAGLQQGLHSRGIDLPMLNNTCDMSLCYCGIKPRQMASLSCPVAYFHHNRSLVLPSEASFLRTLQKNCSDSSYNGCVSCISALDNSMLWIEQKASKEKPVAPGSTSDCRLMGLMWLLATNRTRYIPTVSAVLRALVYPEQSSSSDSPPGHASPAQLCSLDDANLPLASDTPTDSDKSSAWPARLRSPIYSSLGIVLFTTFVLI